MEDRNRPLYMIGVAAQLAGVHPQTLRIYEQKGLVTPQRTSGNTRMYSQADIDRLELINELTSEGINLAGVIRILDLKGRLDERDDEIDDLHKTFIGKFIPFGDTKLSIFHFPPKKLLR